MDLKSDSLDVSDSMESKDKEMITAYEDSVAAHLTKILHCDENTDVISSAKYVIDRQTFNQQTDRHHNRLGDRLDKECQNSEQTWRYVERWT